MKAIGLGQAPALERAKIGLGVKGALNRRERLRGQPTDETHLPAGFAALAPVGKELIHGASGAGTDFKKLLSWDTGCAHNIAIEPAQIDKRFSFFDVDARGRQAPPSFHQRHRHILLHLITTGTDGWAKRDFQIMRFDVVLALE
jgi:hypothetical protein